MQLRQPEPIRLLHHHHRRVGHVHAHLDHRRRHQHVDLSTPEPLHHLLARRPRQLPVQHRHLRARQIRRLELLGHRPHVPQRLDAPLLPARVAVAQRQLVLRAPVDRRRHHVRLLPLRQPPRHLLVHRRPSRRRHHPRRHRLPPRRQPLDRRHVQVPKERDRHRPRNRRRRHHQHVRRARLVARLLPQPRPLHHAEPVLLVDDRHRQVLELHPLRQERVRADQQVDLPRRQPLEQRRLGLLRRGRRARQQFHPHPRALQHPGDRQEVLLGQDLRRRHQARLRARRHGHQHRVERDHRLARAHVALDQAVRRHLTRKVLGDLLHHLLLRGREREGEPLADVRVDPRVPLELGRAKPLAQVRPLEMHAELQQQELVVRQPPPRRLHLRLVRRHVLHAIRLAQRRQPALHAKRLRQVILDQRQPQGHRQPHHPLHRPRLEPLRRRIHRPHPRLVLRRLLLPRQHLDLGVHHLDPRPPLLHLPLHPQPHARHHDVPHEHLVEPHQVQPPRAVVQHRLHPRHPPRPHHPRRRHLAPRARRALGLQPINRRLRLDPLMAQRQVRHQPPQIRDPQRAQPLRLTLRHAWNRLHRTRQLQRNLAHAAVTVRDPDESVPRTPVPQSRSDSRT